MAHDNAYELYQRGCALAASGSHMAAATVLERACEVEPEKTSIRSALGLALFRSRRFSEAADAFTAVIEANPADHHAHYGLGLARSRLGDLVSAGAHLKMACVMRPDLEAYSEALAALERRLGTEG
ncbi:MAG: tetratricopeptide repeat protein [Acidimicrobiia bacterium]